MVCEIWGQAVSPLRPGTETWVAWLLMWIGYSIVVGLVGRAIVPLKKPLGTFATLLLGMVGATVGPIIVQFVYDRGCISPLRPESFVGAVGVAVLLLLGYHLAQPPRKRIGSDR
jgi:uncharacterized membrane protein YeaQ/YmgE (transglycosylase-associated protein family)